MRVPDPEGWGPQDLIRVQETFVALKENWKGSEGMEGCPTDEELEEEAIASVREYVNERGPQ